MTKLLPILMIAALFAGCAARKVVTVPAKAAAKTTVKAAKVATPGK
jgi:hypothetical protein